MKKKIVIGSRESALAVIQSRMLMDYLAEAHPELETELLTMKTTGDRILDRTLDQVGGKGLFVKELDLALRHGRADLTVHSLKDVPMDLPEELPLVCFSRREDPRDALVLPQGCTELAPGAAIGSSSARRALQLRTLFPGHEIRPVRGNLQTRLRKLDAGEYGALVLAAAGLKRLGLEGRIARYFEPEEIIPAAGQGILAVQGRAGEDHSFLAGFSDPAATAAALCDLSVSWTAAAPRPSAPTPCRRATASVSRDFIMTKQAARCAATRCAARHLTRLRWAWCWRSAFAPAGRPRWARSGWSAPALGTRDC